MPDGISKETFKGYDTDSKLDTLFDYVKDTRGDISEVKEALNVRLQRVESNPMVLVGRLLRFWK